MCDNSNAALAADGRALGHLPYGDAPPESLAAAPAALSVSGCVLRREVLPDLARMLDAAAADPASGGRIVALSCHRSIARQRAVFCRGAAAGAVAAGGAAAERAISVAPPGHSEHATGYALDLAFRPRRDGCPDAEACVAAGPGFRWLAANAARYGFELSFPAGNRQGVKWEPWHWRWVGADEATPGAARARGLFARARREWPAEPGIARAPVVIAAVPAPPAWLGAVPAPECRRGKCRVPKRRGR